MPIRLVRQWGAEQRCGIPVRSRISSSLGRFTLGTATGIFLLIAAGAASGKNSVNERLCLGRRAQLTRINAIRFLAR
jgi:hypothetical protein